jgi:hypothetical protein
MNEKKSFWDTIFPLTKKKKNEREKPSISISFELFLFE